MSVELADPASWRRLGGGSICQVWRTTLTDQTPVVVKQTPYPPGIEAEGLQALADAGAPVPAVLAVHAEDDADEGLLVLEEVSGPPDWRALGEALARTHQREGPAFGWHRDNLIGSLPQANEQAAHWPTFYAQQRIVPFLDTPSLPTGVARRLERACAGPLPALLDTDPPASLIHGDLWSGNIVAGRWLIDPAVCHADREHELAFMTVFGGMPAELFDAYQAAWPLPPGWQQRRPALQLYHLLVHVALFGGGYVGAVRSRLDELGW